MIYQISDDDAGPGLDAKIELTGHSVHLQSRGAGRNDDHSKALAIILRRLRAHETAIGPRISRILLDSTLARRVPEEARVLIEAQEIEGLSDAELMSAIRRRARLWGQSPGTKGGNDTKALRLDTMQDLASLRSTLRLRKWTERQDGRSAVKLLSYAEQYQVRTDDIIDAVSRLSNGADAPNFAESRDYDVLLADGTRLAPKKVFGLALEKALGIKAYPKHFHAGWGEPSFQLIEAAGYLIVRKGTPRVGSKKPGALTTPPVSPEDLVFIEGDRRMASHFRAERQRDARAPRLKREEILRKHHRLVCEHCEKDFRDQFEAEVAHGCFEIHHIVPLASINESHEVRLADLLCLCATCHKAVHRAMVLGKPLI